LFIVYLTWDNHSLTLKFCSR